jgi:hypothetical protein
MPFPLLAAGIMAGASLIQGLMGARAAAAQAKTQSEMQAAQAGADAGKNSAQALTEGQQKAFGDMLGAFKGATT